MQNIPNTSTTPHLSSHEQQYAQDALQRIQSWLNLLQGRVEQLLTDNEVTQMKAAEREVAANRCLLLMTRLLKARQEYAKGCKGDEFEEMLRALWQGDGEEL